ncbi:MAG: tripartite tricarboxylate transporter substrate binding protein [Reyranella sp.]|jgi:tripartite-type tricarboxylate transporter receptor subunit TctC|nr:MAG: tripartite tricarboxylate transporter substrate binding protein [Reyranella sp.]
MGITRRAAVAASLAALAVPARAQTEWPKGQPIKVLIPFAPGGVPDIISRIVTPKMGEALAQSFVVDNKPGAGGGLAGQLLTQAAPDGYTLLMGTVSTMSIVPAINPSLKYDPNSFAAIGLAAVVPMVVVVRAESPAQDMKGLVELIKSKPNFNYGSSGNGSILHLTAELFKLRTGLKMQHIPYRGSAPALQALLAGEIDVVFDALPPTMGQIKAGKLRALGLAMAKRSPALPDLKTLGEQGIPGVEAYTWAGLYAPAGTAAPIVTRLNAELLKSLADPENARKISELGYELSPSTPAELQAHTAAELKKWTEVARAADVKAD